jgi:acetolactate decarboxylase
LANVVAMPHLSCYLPHALEIALQRRHAQTGMSKSHIVQAALAKYFDAELHTLFQMSTARSLVAGVFDGAVTVADIERHGDFGLGTFAGLDGEMVVLDGIAYQVRGDGSVEIPSAAAEAPFAIVTFFDGGAPLETGAIESLEAL